MAEFDADVSVSEPFSCEVEECLDDVFVDGDFGEIGGTVSKEDGIVKKELGSHFGESSVGSGQVLEDVCGIVRSTVEAHVSMDAVDRLDESFFSSGVLGSDGEKPLHEEAPGSEVKPRVEVSGRIPEMKSSMLLETMSGVLEGSNPAAETVNAIVHLNTESLGKGDGVIEEPLLTHSKTGGENIESVSNLPAGDEVAAVEETINIDEDKVSVIDNDIADTADLNLTQDCSANLEEARTLEVEEVLTCEVTVADDSCVNSLRESQSLVAGINEYSFDDATQVMEIGDEFPLLEGDGESTEENGKENLTLGTEPEVNGNGCLHKDEKLNTATTKNADAEQSGIDGQSNSSLIDTQKNLQVSADNSSHESVSVSEKSVELKAGTLGNTSAEDHCASMYYSPIEDQTTATPVAETQNLEAHMVNSDQPTATPVSDAVNFDENVLTEETIESYEDAGQNPQRMVLNTCTRGGLVDLYACLDKDEELVKEDVHMEEVESHMMTGAEFSQYFDGSTNANGDIFPEAEIVENNNAEEHEIEMNEHIFEPEQGNDVELKVSEATTPRPRPKVDLATHLLPEESKAEFSVSDLVWGKVKSHPWWPGQVCEPEDASEKAMKHHKNDCFLVAYFGDRTFAWNDGSVLKPFWSNFSRIEKQSSSEVFQNAINCALDEVSRRIMLGLACFCVPNDIYSKIECQIVENTGIREESIRRYGLDESTKASFLKPNKLVEYIRALAESPAAGTGRLGLVIAKAQLLAFNQMRGYYSLPEFEYCGGLLESDDVGGSVLDQTDECTPSDNTENKKLESENRNSLKRKHNLKDGSYSSKREKRLSELMGDEGSVEQDKRISFYAAKVSSTVSPIPKPSFKVGDCIRRAASQLTGSLSISRNGNEKLQKVNRIIDMQTPDNSHTSPVENSSLDEMLLQLQMLARDPVKGHSYGYGITSFFSGFRDSIHLCHYVGRMSSATEKPDVARKRKASHGSPEEFEFDDVGDSYWTDMIVDNQSEGQPGGFLSSKHYQLVTLDAENSLKSSRRGPKKRFSNGNHHELALDEPMKHINQVRQANLPVELILNFPEADSIPSETHLNKSFRRFGPLKETDTLIDLETSHARVVFKRCSDAEVAFNSSKKFSIFGPVFVNYQLNYSPATTLNTFTFATSEELEDAA